MAVATYQERAERYLRKWQRILRLQDWDITLRYARRYDIHNEALASCRTKVVANEAEIALCDPDDVNPALSKEDQNVEITIIHELMHVKLSPLFIPDGYHTEHERIVESMARTMFALAGEEK